MAAASHAAALELRQTAGDMQGVMIARGFERYRLVFVNDPFPAIPQARSSSQLGARPERMPD
jgi:hypothetical protein